MVISRQIILFHLKKILPLTVVFLILALLPVLMQYLHLLDVKETLHWIKIFKGPYRVNAAIIVFLFLCCYVLFNSIFPALSTVVIFCLTFCVVDMQKMRILHQPLLPADLLFVRQALLVTGIYARQALAGFIIPAVLAIGTFLMRKKLPRYRLALLPRVAVAALLGAALYLCITRFHTLVPLINKRQKIVNEFWDQLSNFRKNGLLYGFLLNIQSLRVHKPSEYGREAVERIFFFDSVTVTLPAASAIIPAPKANPDVIVYVNESFWDIGHIASVKLPRDPIPVFHSKGKNFRRTRLISPVFGGNTCIAEFEILTGMSHGFFPPGSIAYNQFIRRPVPSLAKVFKENGYRTIAIHSFKKWFWNRFNVYRHLGFDDFISVESMEQPEIKGTYVADEELARYIVKYSAADTAPRFIFALSMQNHGPYTYERYPVLDKPIKTGLSPSADREYNTFLQGIIDADKSLKIIIDYVKKSHKPILLLFFGDHLPGFIHVFKETEYEQMMNRNTLCRYTTTALWYANFPLPQQSDTVISMVYLPLLIARYARIAIPPYYRFLDNIRSEYPIFTGDKRIDPLTGRAITPTPHSRMQDRACSILIYDALFGKGFAEQYHHVKQ